MSHQTPRGYKEPFEQMDGNSCKLGVVPNVGGADVCARVAQPESDPTLSCSHISAASFNSELHIKSCTVVTVRGLRPLCRRADALTLEHSILNGLFCLAHSIVKS